MASIASYFEPRSSKGGSGKRKAAAAAGPTTAAVAATSAETTPQTDRTQRAPTASGETEGGGGREVSVVD